MSRVTSVSTVGRRSPSLVDAARRERRALLERLGDPGLDALRLLLVDQRRHVGRLVERVADLERLDRGHERRQELVVDLLVDHHALHRDADLARSSKTRRRPRAAAARSRSASSSTMVAELLPSSRVTIFMPASPAICRPTGGLPVKVTMFTRSSLTSFVPRVRPGRPRPAARSRADPPRSGTPRDAAP